jgi:hypothetical protein
MDREIWEASQMLPFQPYVARFYTFIVVIWRFSKKISGSSSSTLCPKTLGMCLTDQHYVIPVSHLASCMLVHADTNH